MTSNRRAGTAIGIVEAVETLSGIADLDLDTGIAVAEDHELMLQGEAAPYRSVQWLRKGENDKTLSIIRETFKVVLRYLKNFYETEYEHLHKPETIEEIKTIMVLVGEAAQKLDRCATIFKSIDFPSISSLTEYRNLQKFYQTKISKRIDQGYVTRWLKHLPQQADDRVSNIKLRGRKKVSSKHVFVDLDTVKRDTEYELFFIRKENGTRYFNPRLIRNIKLVCDFGDYFGSDAGTDPLRDVHLWLDKVMHLAACQLAKQTESILDDFYRESRNRKVNRFGKLLRKAAIALLLAANDKNLQSNAPVKSCRQYFNDFQVFLRNALTTRQYQKMLAYPPGRSNSYRWSQMGLTQQWCSGIHHDLKGIHQLAPVIQELIDAGNARRSKNKKSAKGPINKLVEDHKAVSKVMKGHPQGPLMKVLDLMQEFGSHSYDPLLQHNLPNLQYNLVHQRRKISDLRLPSPTRQEFIHRARVTPEFRSFLSAYRAGHHRRHHLLINLQNRTSWREHLRSSVLEEFGRHKDFRDVVTVATLAKDTDFYYQLDPYHNVNHADQFKAQLLDLFMDKQGGYFFSTSIRKLLIGEWINGIMNAIHQFFFNGRNVLSRRARLDFIEIFHVLLELKLVDASAATSFSFTCKDGVDVGAVSSAQLYLFQKLVNNRKITSKDIEHLGTMLFAPALMVRERNTLNDRFHRAISAIKHIETCAEEMGGRAFATAFVKLFKPYFDTPILKAKTDPI
ncbi:hypothetical protein SCG7086_AQ_00200 [Chlamydiales bacterium SCGC AG-110-P3]|nr:hypothetical protein SCG7086_AQ_00200 [Chlamydiales bacterium SCGC AG-110-P3]